MKTLLPFLILLLSFSKGYSHAYTPFPETNAVWTGYFNWCESQNFFFENHIQTRFNGDTLINGLIYHKLVGQELNASGTCDIFPYNFGTNVYVDTIPFLRLGYLRQDTAFRRVYYLQSDTSTETILYDFNLSVGDTVTRFFSGANCRYDSVKVLSIDTLIIDKPYRRYNFDVVAQGAFGPFHQSTSWIEGIGSTQSLLYLRYCDYQLTCFSRSDSTIYPYFSTTACAILTGVNEVPQQITALHIYPNPTTNTCTLKWNDTPGLFTAALFDLTGREVMPLFTQKHISTFNFNAEPLPAGLYFVKLTDNTGHFAVSKLVKE